MYFTLIVGFCVIVTCNSAHFKVSSYFTRLRGSFPHHTTNSESNM